MYFFSVWYHRWVSGWIRPASFITRRYFHENFKEFSENPYANFGKIFTFLFLIYTFFSMISPLSIGVDKTCNGYEFPLIAHKQSPTNKYHRWKLLAIDAKHTVLGSEMQKKRWYPHIRIKNMYRVVHKKVHQQ